MLVVFWSIFVVDKKIIFGYNFVAPIINSVYLDIILFCTVMVKLISCLLVAFLTVSLSKCCYLPLSSGSPCHSPLLEDTAVLGNGSDSFTLYSLFLNTATIYIHFSSNFAQI